MALGSAMMIAIAVSILCYLLTYPTEVEFRGGMQGVLDKVLPVQWAAA